jgi:hypothetical protein
MVNSNGSMTNLIVVISIIMLVIVLSSNNKIEEAETDTKNVQMETQKIESKMYNHSHTNITEHVHTTMSQDTTEFIMIIDKIIEKNGVTTSMRVKLIGPNNFSGNTGRGKLLNVRDNLLLEK